MQARVDSQE